MEKIVLLKLGGSLITDKTKPYTPKLNIIKQLAIQIKQALEEDKNLRLIIGNGGGSFPHYPAVKYKVSEGVKTEIQKEGMCKVQDAASRLNRIIVSNLLDQKINAFSYNPSSGIITENGKIKEVFFKPLIGLLELNIVPVLYGDIVYDEKLGCKILSTEVLLSEVCKFLLKKKYKVVRIIHNGLTPGVLDKNNKLIPVITKENFSKIKHVFYSSEGFDVTGGMLHKVQEALKLADLGVETLIINGVQEKDILKNALLGKPVRGTKIT